MLRRWQRHYHLPDGTEQAANGPSQSLLKWGARCRKTQEADDYHPAAASALLGLLGYITLARVLACDVPGVALSTSCFKHHPTCGAWKLLDCASASWPCLSSLWMYPNSYPWSCVASTFEVSPSGDQWPSVRNLPRQGTDFHLSYYPIWSPATLTFPVPSHCQCVSRFSLLAIICSSL